MHLNILKGFGQPVNAIMASPIISDFPEKLIHLYNFDGIIKYFEEFYSVVETELDLDLADVLCFFNCLSHLEQNGIFISSVSRSTKSQECFQILYKIFETLSLKHFYNSLKTKVEEFDSPLYDLILLLVKMLSKQEIGSINEPVQIMFICLKEYLKIHLDKHGVLTKHLHYPMKFLFELLKSFDHSSITRYLNQQLMLEIIDSIPFYDNFSLNLFVIQILPFLIENYPSKIITNHLWQTRFKKEQRNNIDETQLFVLLHAVFEHVFNNKENEISDISIISHDLPRMIQDGCISSSFIVRRQAISLFKMMLYWVKSHQYISEDSLNGKLFCVMSENDVNVWEDFCTLLAVLEEKQIHVIKPVLPKFSRFLHHASIKNSDDAKHFLHPSWIICFITKMLKHERKSVVREGLFLALNLDYPQYNVELMYSKKFLHQLLEAVDDQNIYSSRINETDSSFSLSYLKMISFLNSFISAFNSIKQQAIVLRHLLQSISNHSWSSVPLMHLTFALANLHCMPAWKVDDIAFIRNFLEVSLLSFESIIRNAIESWMLKAILNLLDWKLTGLFDMTEILFIFKCLRRHTYEWEFTVAKVQEILSSGDYNGLTVSESKRFCMTIIEKILDPVRCDVEMEKPVRMLLLLADCGIILPTDQGNTLSWPSLLKPLSMVLTDAPKRPYLSSQVFHDILKFYLTLIAESENNSKVIDDAHTVSIKQSVNFSRDFIEFLFEKSLNGVETLNDIIFFQTLSHAFRVFSSLCEKPSLYTELHLSFIAKCKKMSSDLPARNLLGMLLYITLNSHLKKLQLSDVLSDSILELSVDLLSWLMKEHVIDNLTKHKFIDRCLKDAWRELISCYVCLFWQDTAVIISFISSKMVKSIDELLIREVLKSLDSGLTSCVVPCINCLKYFIPRLEADPATIKILIDSAWVAVSELHGSEIFRSAFSSFVSLLCQPYLLHKDTVQILYSHIGDIQEKSETSFGILYVLTRHFCDNFDLKFLVATNHDFIPFLVQALTYGPVHHKGQQILAETIAFFQDHDPHFVTSDFNQPSFCVRVISASYLMKQLKERCSENETIALLIINSLLDLDSSTRASTSSKFSNSFSHRLRTRIWQSILFLHSNVIEPANHELLFSKTLDIMEVDNQQFSVRFLEEWVLFNILCRCKHLIVKFISKLESSYNMHPVSCVSLLSVLFHLISSDLISCEEYICRCFTLITRFCMAQNFAVRLYGRLVLTKLFSWCEDKKLINVIDKFSFLSASVVQTEEKLLSDKGNIYKNFIKLSKDFYFCKFNPTEHFTMETIFFELPRLSNLSSEEWIKPVYFSSEMNAAEVSIQCLNPDELLKNSVATEWTDRNPEPKATEKHLKSELLDYNFQKKICPKLNLAHDFVVEASPKNNLIVVASLIDRVPNLGGLCRTCEIFGVGQFVIGSLKYAADKEFKSLAVSADKWVNIKEVKPYNLKKYLLALKEEGYTLVGAEQTDSSQKLDSFVFPRNSVVLLGHEKEGMPVDLIQLLDVCVEIPQKGVVRSLNVHVSGALFIWEYTKQHME